jgi:hypothetical protein
MSFHDQLIIDNQETFLVPEELGHEFEFEIIEDGLTKRFTARCCWDEHTLRNRLIVQQQGVYLGSVLWFIEKSHFKVQPKPEQVVYRFIPHREGWRIVDMTDAEELYEIYLDKLIA